MSKTAVVILNWNGLEYLQKFLNILTNRTNGIDSSVWLVDNGSTDDSVKWAEENCKSVSILKLGVNHGYAGGYREALEQIKADYYVLVNSDIEVTDNWLEPLVDFMDSNPQTAACQPKILSFYKRDYFEHAGASGGFLDKYGYPFCRGRIFNIVETDTGQYNTETPVFWASGACMMVRESAYNEAGGLDSSFFAHMEEIDLCWRFHKLGYNVFCIPQSVVYHVGGGTLKYDTPGKTYLNFRNNLYMLYKNLPEMGFNKTLFIRKILDGIAGIVFLFSGKPRHVIAIIRAHIDFYSARTKLKPEREKNLKMKNGNSVPDNLILNKSIIVMFHLRRLRRFSDLTF